MLRESLGTFCLWIGENIFPECDNKCSQTECGKAWERKYVDGKNLPIRTLRSSRGELRLRFLLS